MSRSRWPSSRPTIRCCQGQISDAAVRWAVCIHFRSSRWVATAPWAYQLIPVGAIVREEKVRVLLGWVLLIP